MHAIAFDKSNQSTCFNLVLKNQLSELKVLSDWIGEISEEIQLSPEITFRLDLILSEAVTNVIEYAFADESDHRFEVSLRCTSNAVIVELKDDGIPFNPVSYPCVVKPSSLEEAQEGGLGIHLIRSYVNEFQYHRNDNQNILTMILCHSDT